ncbi:twin-arginine translocation signal domain-containing protein [Rhodovulum sp. DZ06]|uniref:twin-arginine translocation signal domain-containing protein n=1 Tax=Rhodovulum sp. DZ06 TaxID=3425126 RepID=UPI003D35405D
MAKSNETADESRRGFLKLSAAAPAVAVAAATGVATTETAEAAPKASSGLQDTPHTRAYYDSARF